MKSQRFLSVRSAIEAALLNQHSPDRALSAEQREAQDELRSSFHGSPSGLIVPFHERRDLTATGGDGGGNALGTDVPEAGTALRSALRLAALGARILTGLRADVTLPYGVGTLSAEWLGENEAAGDLTEELRGLSLTPKRICASVPVSMQLILQGGAVFDRWINDELFGLLASEIERVAINGAPASDEPRGILNTSGIGAVVGGTNGAAPDLTDLADLEFAVTGTGKADTGPLGFFVSPRVRRKLRLTFINGTGSPALWPHDSADRLLGHPAAVSTASPDNLTKGSASGVCSAITFGMWSELFVGFFGRGITIEVVRDKADVIAGRVQVQAAAYLDVGVRNPKAFATMKDALCAP